jgi:hypothetical protein
MLYQKANSLGYEIAPENIPFEQKDKSAVWVEFYHLPNFANELSKDGRIERLGLVQLSFFALTDNGRGDILAAIDSALLSFKSGTEVNDIASQIKVIINQSDVGAGMQDGNFYRADLTIQYRAFYG